MNFILVILIASGFGFAAWKLSGRPLVRLEPTRRKKFIRLFLILAVLSLADFSYSRWKAGHGEILGQLKWKEVVSAGSGFKVSFPADPEVKLSEKITAADGGNLKTHSLKWIDAGENLALGVSYFDSLDGKPLSLSVFDQTRDAMLANSGGKLQLLGEKSVALGNIAGRELEFKVGDVRIKTRQFILNRRFFQLEATYLNEKKVASAVDVFFHSWQIDESAP